MLRRISEYLEGRIRGPARMDQNARYAGHSVGRFTYGYPTIASFPDERATLVIGSFCSFAPGVRILLGGHHFADWVSTYPFNRLMTARTDLPVPSYSRGNVTIGNDVWVATDALILSGVTIGDGAIIGARAVVASDVPPYTLYAGVPAKLIRSRFAPEIVAALQEIAWWNWSDDKIVEELPYIMSPKIETFVQRHGTRPARQNEPPL